MYQDEDDSTKEDESGNVAGSASDNKHLFTPAAILLAGIMISGSIVYATGVASSGTPPSESFTAQVVTAVPAKNQTFYQEIAEQMGLNMEQFDTCVAEEKYENLVREQQREGVQLGITGTPGGFVNDQPVRGAIPYAQLKDIIDSVIATGGSSFPDGLTITEGDHIRGNIDAPITIVEFSDFQCPFCGRFHPTLKKALEEYGDNIRWVYKHFPLEQIHPEAVPAALAAECAAEQKGNEGFWQYGDALFANQDRLGT